MLACQNYLKSNWQINIAFLSCMVYVCSVPHKVDCRTLSYFLAYEFNGSRPLQKKLANLYSECCVQDVPSCSYSWLFVSCFVWF